jgi:hypothetical protein
MVQKKVKLYSNTFQSLPPPSSVHLHETKHWYFKLFMQVDFPDDEVLKTLRWQLCFFFILCKNKVMSLVKPQSTITIGLLVITITYFTFSWLVRTAKSYFTFACLTCYFTLQSYYEIYFTIFIIHNHVTWRSSNTINNVSLGLVSQTTFVYQESIILSRHTSIDLGCKGVY